jgi:hypothetical protein
MRKPQIVRMALRLSVASFDSSAKVALVVERKAMHRSMQHATRGSRACL